MGSNKPKYLRPEDVADNMRPFVDFDKQELRWQPDGKYRRVRAWVQCPDCKQWRWVAVQRLRLGLAGTYKSTRCHSCTARRLARKHHPPSPDWYSRDGYRRINVGQLDGEERWLAEQMTNRARTVEEHRLVAARCLGRPLESGEHVHHLDGTRDNNSPDNLMITSSAFHFQLTRLEYWAEREALTMFTADGVPYRARARVAFERVE